MKNTLLLSLLIGLAAPLSAQQTKVDSLKALLQTATDTNRVNLLNTLCKSLWYNQLDKASAYNQRALSLADSLSYRKGQAEATRCRGVLYFLRGDTTGAPYLLKALALFRQINDQRGIAATLNNLSRLYERQNTPPKAREVLEQALAIFTRLKDREAEGAVINVIGNIYHGESDYPNALQYYLKALAIRQEIHDQPGTAHTLGRIGDMYAALQQFDPALEYYRKSMQLSEKIKRNGNIIDAATGMGNVYQQQGKYSQALVYCIRALKAAEAYYGKDSVAWPYQRIGEVYQAQKHYPLALENFQKALRITAKKDANGTATILNKIGQVYQAQGEYAKALENSLRSMELARQSRSNRNIENASLTLSQTYAALRNYPEAYRYHLLFTTAKDSLLREDLNQKLALLQNSLELKNKQTQIDLLTKDKQLQQSEINRQTQQRYAFVGGFILFAILMLVLIRNNRQKQYTNRLLTRKTEQVAHQNTQLQQAFGQLSQQKEEIETQRDTLNELNTEVMAQRDSVERAFQELKATQNQLIQSAKMASLGELTAGIAHEIQNPLNFVTNFSEVSAELVGELVGELDKGDPDEARTIAGDLSQNLQKITLHGQRASSIVKSMLEHSRTSTGEKQPTDLNALADEYLRLAYHGLRAKDKEFYAELKTDFDPNLGTVNVVPQEMGRVLLNLFNNAFYAVSEKKKQPSDHYKPTVGVRTQRRNGKIVICVSDNGMGMPEAVKSKIFQPFFTTKPTGQGTGLGLSLSYDIVTKGHSGTLDVETNEGKGTEFIITLSHTL